MKSRLLYTQLFGILALIVILIISIPLYSNRIPKELTQEVQQKLKNNNLNWVSVRAKGRDIILSGISPTIEEHKKAIEVSEKIRAIRVVYDKISPMIITPYTMNIQYKDKELILDGYMPSKESKNYLLNYLKDMHSDFNIIDKIDIGTGEPKEWESLILLVSLLMDKLDAGMVNIVDKDIIFSGRCQTSEIENEVLLYVDRYKDMGFTIKSRIVAMDEAVLVCKVKFKNLLSEDKIMFEAGKSIVKSSSMALLNGLAETFTLCPSSQLKVIGYTDSRGDINKNRELSKNRAKAVVAKLFNLGIPLEQMEAIGKGIESPVATNETEEGRAKNRRIEFELVGE